jgi:hypothetical protein
MCESLRKEVNTFSRKNFPEMFIIGFRQRTGKILEGINSPTYGILIPLCTFVTLLLAAIVHGPTILQWRIISRASAITTIDQRTTNLATIVSVSLVVIGWLITNISNKEAISLKLLFKRTRMYPISYFIFSLIGSLMIFSAMKDVAWLNMGNVLITATCLILIALGLIATLFIHLVNVVNTNFLSQTLEKEVLKELYYSSRDIVRTRKSRTLFSEACLSFNLSDENRFNVDLSGHTALNISPEPIATRSDSATDIITQFFPEPKFIIYDISITKLKRELTKLQIVKPSYYNPISLETAIPPNYHLFYLKHNQSLHKKGPRRIRKCFRLITYKAKVTPPLHFQSYLHEKFLKEVKAGNLEGMKNSLEIYSKILAFERKIYTQC